MNLFIHKISVLLFAFLLPATVSLAQEESKHLFGVETGIQFLDGEIIDKEFVRASVSSYNYDYYDYGWPSNLFSSRFFFGVTDEYLIKPKKFSLLFGLRYAVLKTSVSDYSDGYSSSDDMLLNFRNTDDETYLLRVKSFDQNPHFLAVPIGVKMIFVDKGFFQLYLKTTLELNFRLKEGGRVNFVNNEMNIYEKDVLNMMGSPARYYSAFVVSPGIRWVNNDKFILSTEADLPYAPLKKDISSLAQLNVGGGVRLNLQFPISR